MRVNFNINEQVGVRLTPHALDCLRKEYRDFWDSVGEPPPYPYREPKPDKDGICWFQLWDLMQKLGPSISIAGPLLFERCEMVFDTDYIPPQE